MCVCVCVCVCVCLAVYLPVIILSKVPSLLNTFSHTFARQKPPFVTTILFFVKWTALCSRAMVVKISGDGREEIAEGTGEWEGESEVGIGMGMIMMK